MRPFRSFLSRLKEPLLAGPRDADLLRELTTHFEMLTDDNRRAGMSPEDARRQARIALGGVDSLTENCRDARAVRWLTEFIRDLRHALRALRHKPGFAVVAILTLALGIGATAVMFTVIDGVLLKPLPYPEPDRLVTVNEWTDKASAFGNLWAFTYPNFVDCRRDSHALLIAGSSYKGGTLGATQKAAAEHVDGFAISSELFPVLGISVAAGRAFTPSDDRVGASPVMIISHELWQRRFAGRRDAIGQTITFDGHPWTIAGIAPARFRLSQEADVYVPLGQSTEPVMQSRFVPTVRAIARLRPGYTLEQARKELDLIGHRLASQYPQSNTGRTMVAAPMRVDVSAVQSTLWLLLGAVTLVLLIACVNIASLLLARAVSREREISMRAAIGASRIRLARQCLTESVVLATAGGILGLLLAIASLRPFLLFWPGTLPRAGSIHIDWRVLLFALAASLCSGILFGLAPALRAPIVSLEHSLRGARSVSGASRRLHTVFVVAEIALALVLLISSGMLGRTLVQLASLDPGVDLHNVLVTRAALSPATLANPAGTRTAWKDLLERAARVPGVQAVAMVDTVPMREGNNELPWSTTTALPPPDKQPLAIATSVTPQYLDVMGIRLRAGRFFNEHDRLDGELVAVIDDVFARKAFQTRIPADAVGRQLWFPDIGPNPVRVVGVVGHVRHWGLAGDDQAAVRAQFYYPFSQVPDVLVHRWSDLMSVAVRTRVEPMSLLPALRRAAAGAGSDQVLYEERTMEGLASRDLARQRFLLLLFGIFAGLALLLACIGVYGVLAYLASQRISEVGVRMALGATSGDVLGLVLRQSAGMILGGVIAGLVGAFAAGRLLERFVSGMRAVDAGTVAAMVAVLVAAALLASFLPARRASRIEPMSALRQE
ncbi:MAG TPA: ABC transporter permease [Bryobacteraceae bacterium]|nr:ABC transporter permease [Bryobacteraceae bacterium]